VNFPDITQVVENFCGYTSLSHLGVGRLMAWSVFRRGTLEALAHHRWHIHVSFSYHALQVSEYRLA
jgi:hypothetical protein